MLIWTTEPAARFGDCLPIGNGRLGAMIPGQVSDEVIVINDQTLWAGSPYNPNPRGAREKLPLIRRLLFSGRYREAQDLCWALFSRPLSVQNYQPLGELQLRFDVRGPVRDYRRELDLNAGVVRVSYRIGSVKYTREIFASYPDQVLVFRFSCDTPGGLSLTVSLSSVHVTARTYLGLPTELIMQGRNTPMKSTKREDERARALGLKVPETIEIPASLRWQARLRVLNQGGSIEAIRRRSGQGASDALRIDKADNITLVLAAATSYVNWNDADGDPDRLCRQRIKAAEIRYPRLYKRHLDDYGRLFRRVRLALRSDTQLSNLSTSWRLARMRNGGLDNELIVQHFQYGRYLMLAQCRQDTLPINNHNLWNDALEPGWSGRWTLNINLQACYWPAETCDMPETVMSLLRFMEELSEAGARTARELYGCRGWVAHHGTDIWLNTAPTDGPRWGMSPICGAWMCQPLWEHYFFDPDPSYLKRIYPLLKGAALFFLDFMTEDPRTGWLVVCPSHSPENSFRASDGQVSALSAGTALDAQVLRDLFSVCVEAGRVLGVDTEFRDTLLQAQAKLPPHQIGKHGQLMEWLEDFEEVEPHHRHYSQLYAFFPSSQITRRGTPALAQAVRKVIERRGFVARGLFAAWALNLWTRFEEGNKSHDILYEWLRSEPFSGVLQSDMLPLMDANQGIQGLTSGIAEMMVQSHVGAALDRAGTVSDSKGYDEIHLLPALPQAWPDGRVEGLRARGGYLLDILWRGGRLDQAIVRSKYNRRCVLRAAQPVEIRSNGRLVAATGEDAHTVEWAPEAGVTYVVRLK
ncbi:MAG: glycoside hydrolase N-terminal domain-containing protein [Acidobacteriota bacterium]